MHGAIDVPRAALVQPQVHLLHAVRRVGETGIAREEDPVAPRPPDAELKVEQLI